jgi:hypothetical protein
MLEGVKGVFPVHSSNENSLTCPPTKNKGKMQFFNPIIMGDKTNMNILIAYS